MGILYTIKQLLGLAENTAPLPTPAGAMPVVGVSGGSADSKSVAAMMSSLRAQGTQPVFIGNHAERNLEQDFATMDAVVILGNNADIDPAKYGQAKHAATNIETDLARAAYEEALIAKALAAKKPLLGICGGMQRINVLGGGTLMQHVPDAVGNNLHTQGDIPPFIPVQVVKMEAGTRLGAIAASALQHAVYTPGRQPLPPGVSMENSMHHQAVDKVRADFVVAARSSDGIIEAIEPARGSRYADQYVMAVQWHPEFAPSAFSSTLVADFAGAAKAYGQSHPTPHVIDDVWAASESAYSSSTFIAKAAGEGHPAAGDWQRYIQQRRTQQPTLER